MDELLERKWMEKVRDGGKNERKNGQKEGRKESMKGQEKGRNEWKMKEEKRMKRLDRK